MPRKTLVILALVASSLVVGAQQARAATFIYPSAACPAGPTGLTDCIDGAADNDTIKVKKGTYYENVVVNRPITVAASACNAANRVILDASPPAPPAAGTQGHGFDIESDDVTIDCFTVRHANDAVHNEGMTLDGHDDLTVRRLTAYGVGDGVYSSVNGDRITVEKSVFKFSNGEGIDVDGGTDVRVIGNRCFSLGSSCAELTQAPGAVANGNSAKTIDDGSVVKVFESPDAEIRNNKADATEDPISAYDSPGTVIAGNRLIDVVDGGVYAQTHDVEITGNRFSGVFGGSLIEVYTDDPPTNIVVTNNNGTRATAVDDAGGVAIYANDTAPCPGDCVVVHNNKMANTTEAGIYVSADYASVVGNTSRSNGESDSGQGLGFYLDVGTSTVVENIAIGNSDEGFQVYADNTSIEGNMARGNIRDGFEINDGDFGDNVVEDNVSIANQGDGIDNRATNTDLIDNVSKRNRLDCGNDGSIGTNTGNVCADGSNFTVPGSLP